MLDDFWSICAVAKIQNKGFWEEEEKDSHRAEEVLDIIKNVCGDSMTVGMQEDAHEFLIKLLEDLVETWSKKNITGNSSGWDETDCNDISVIFKGTLSSCVTCSTCESSYKTIQPFYDLNLELNENVEKSMDNFFSQETLNGNNKYNCSDWKDLSDAIKTLSIRTAPPILIINMKRFKRGKIKYPMKFSLNDYLEDKEHDKLEYELNALIIHEGRFNYRGHYYCYVKAFDNRWYKWDDHMITQVDDEEDLMGHLPYILFYRLKTKRSKKADYRWEHLDNIKQIKVWWIDLIVF